MEPTMTTPNSEAHMIQVTIEPIKDPTLPEGPNWGLPAGPLPLITKEIIRPEQEEICPHCHQKIQEKESYLNFDTKQHFHRNCGGEYIPPAVSAGAQALLDAFSKQLGLAEGLLREEKQEDKTIYVRTEKPNLLFCESLITEAMAKGVEERIHRRTRRSKGLVKKKVGPAVPRKTANNDPTKTSRGRTNFRGTKKKSQDDAKKLHPELFKESAEFIRNTYGQLIDVVLEHAAKLHDPIDALDLLAKLKSDPGKLDKAWLNNTSNAIVTMLEGREYRTRPFLALLASEPSQEGAKALVAEEITKIKKFFPDAWVERTINESGGTITFRVHGPRGPRYYEAEAQGLIQAI